MMQTMTTQAWEDYRLQQLRRAAAWPLWRRLQWLEEALRVAEHLHSHPVAPPSWARKDPSVVSGSDSGKA